MVAIPQQEYNYLRNAQQVNNPVQSQFSSLSNDYRRQSYIEDPYIKIYRQGETLDEMKRLKEELRQRAIQLTPKKFKKRAEDLMTYVEGNMEFNDKGELLDSSGQPIIGSNVTDLIQHAVRDRQRNFEPAGWNVFRNRLQGVNVPLTVLNYKTLDEMKQPLSIKSSPTTSPLKNPSPVRKRKLEFPEENIPLEIKKKSSRQSPKIARKRTQPSRYIDDKKYF